MSLDADLLLDRRRLKRRLNFWRVLAVVAFAAAVLVAVRPSRGGLGTHIARVELHGIITQDRKLLAAVQALEKDKSVAAVIVDIDSPGGSVGGGESLHGALLRVAAVKPVVAVMGGTAASAGYMVALPAARIFARDSTVTGSIGVIMETGEVSGLLARLGVTAEAITSGPLKDQPSFTRPLTPEGREYLRGVVDDMYDVFVGMVAGARNLDKGRVRELADGRVYTGRQALKLGLIDEIGGEPEARAYLAKWHVPETVPVETLETKPVVRQWLGATVAGLGEAISGLLIEAGWRPPGAWAIWR